jgi:hypothetical protein
VDIPANRKQILRASTAIAKEEEYPQDSWASQQRVPR